MFDDPPEIVRVSAREKLGRGHFGVGTSTSIKDHTAVAMNLGHGFDKGSDIGFVAASGQSVEEDQGWSVVWGQVLQRGCIVD